MFTNGPSIGQKGDSPFVHCLELYNYRRSYALILQMILREGSGIACAMAMKSTP